MSYNTLFPPASGVPVTHTATTNTLTGSVPDTVTEITGNLVVQQPLRPRRHWLNCVYIELRAREAFKLDGSHENLTKWADARNALEEARMKL